MSTNTSGSTSPGGRRWTTPAWRVAAIEWITTVLSEHGARVTGPIDEVRSRFWSIHLVAPTSAGRFWFKENCPGQAFEASLVSVLLPIVGDRIQRVTATNADEGWLLTPDQGRSLWDAGRFDAPDFERLLTDYGQLQRTLMIDNVDLPAAGLTTMDPSAAEQYLLEHVDRLHGLPVDDPGRLDDAAAERLRTLGPTVRRWADTVSSTGLPLTLEHSDLHPGNAFDAPAGASLRIFDWGDAVRAFPLCSLLVPMRTMTSTDVGLPGLAQSAVDRVVDAYLEVFSDLTPMAELRAALPAALELAKLNRHESWRRALAGADSDSYADAGGAPAAWLAMIGTS